METIIEFIKNSPLIALQTVVGFAIIKGVLLILKFILLVALGENNVFKIKIKTREKGEPETWKDIN